MTIAISGRDGGDGSIGLRIAFIVLTQRRRKSSCSNLREVEKRKWSKVLGSELGDASHGMGRF